MKLSRIIFIIKEKDKVEKLVNLDVAKTELVFWVLVQQRKEKGKN